MLLKAPVAKGLRKGARHSIVGKTRIYYCDCASPMNSPIDKPTVAEPPTIRLQNILVPIDFSDPCKRALKYATAFARQFDATLTLLHVVEFDMVLSDLGPAGISFIEVETKSKEASLQRLADWAATEVGDRVRTETLVRNGRPYWDIVEVARSLPADLILIASHGHSSLAHVVLGSTVERVVRHAPCPVLVVRPQERDFISEPVPAAGPVKI